MAKNKRVRGNVREKHGRGLGRVVVRQAYYIQVLTVLSLGPMHVIDDMSLTVRVAYRMISFFFFVHAISSSTHHNGDMGTPR